MQNSFEDPVATIQCSSDDPMATTQSCSDDDAPCMTCTELVDKDSKALQCDLCTGWVHIGCAGVGSKAYSTLQSLKGSVWMCASCLESLPSIPREISALRAENSTLRAQLNELSRLPGIIKAMEQKLETLSHELETAKSEESGWTVVQGGKRSPPPPPAACGSTPITNRFSPLALSMEEKVPNSHPTHPISTNAESPRKADTNTYTLKNSLQQTGQTSQSMNNLFYLRAIPRETALAEVKEKLDSFGVPSTSLVVPPNLSTTSRRMFLTLSLSTEEANRLHDALISYPNLGWFVSNRPPRAPRSSPPPNRNHPPHHSMYYPGQPPIRMDPPPKCDVPIVSPHPQQAHIRSAGPLMGSMHSACSSKYIPPPPSFAQVAAGHMHGNVQQHSTPFWRASPPQTQNFRSAIPPLMSLRLGHGMCGAGT